MAQMVSHLKYPFWDYGLLDCERKTQIQVPFLFRQRKERLVKFGNVELFIFVWVSCSVIFKTTDHPSKNDRIEVEHGFLHDGPKRYLPSQNHCFLGDMMTSSILTIPSSSHPNEHIDYTQALS